MEIPGDTDELEEVELRYGENPHQEAKLYRDEKFGGVSVAGAEKLGGKKMSFNNYYDADSAFSLVRELQSCGAVVVKHGSPCGVAVSDSCLDAYLKAEKTDQKSAYGGIVALNNKCDFNTAEAICNSFKEVVIAPSFDDEALRELRKKENLRILKTGEIDAERDRVKIKKIEGGFLVHDGNPASINKDDLEIVTERKPSEDQIKSMIFGFKIAESGISNSVVLVKNKETVGIGVGQPSRVDAVKMALMKAKEDSNKNIDGSILVSDGFFPFRDNIDKAGKEGIGAVIQPGGSIRDDEVIEACNELGIPMAFTGKRCFRH